MGTPWSACNTGSASCFFCILWTTNQSTSNRKRPWIKRHREQGSSHRPAVSRAHPASSRLRVLGPPSHARLWPSQIRWIKLWGKDFEASRSLPPEQLISRDPCTCYRMRTLMKRFGLQTFTSCTLSLRGSCWTEKRGSSSNVTLHKNPLPATSPSRPMTSLPIHFIVEAREGKIHPRSMPPEYADEIATELHPFWSRLRASQATRLTGVDDLRIQNRDITTGRDWEACDGRDGTRRDGNVREHWTGRDRTNKTMHLSMR